MFLKFTSFALVGVLGTAAHYQVLYLLVESQGFDPVMASGYGAIAGLLVNYVLNFKLTFNSTQSHTRAFPKFALIASFGMGFNLALMAVLTQRFYYLYAQVLTTLLVLIWNFFANTFWTFKMDKTANPSTVRLANVLKILFSGWGLIAAIVLIRLLTLGWYPLYDPSEARYAEMARKMLESGNWVTPMIDYGVPFWGKPPLTIWLSAISMGLGGINEFAVRLPSFLLGAGIGWAVYYLAKIQRGGDYAVSSVLALGSSVLFFVMSGSVAMDQAMSFGVTLALVSFWLALRGENRYWGYVFFIGLSVGLMAKGPITLVLSGTCIGLWTLITGRWLDIWKSIPWFSGCLLMLCVCLPWYLIAEQSTPGFLEYFFIGEHWKRFTESGWKGDLYGVGRAHPRGMIWVYWLLGGFPWVFVILKRFSVAAIRKQAGTLVRSDDDWRLYCLLWMLAPLLFFTFSANVIWTYVLPGLPGLALLVADQLQLKTVQRAVLTLCVPLGFLAVVIAYYLPGADFFRSQKRLVEAYQQQAAADEHLVYLNEKTYSIQFYLQGIAIEVQDSADLNKMIAGGGHDFYVVRKPVFESLSAAAKARLTPVSHYGEFTLFHGVAG
ncbi:MAG: phospholipid carrier-dependent glycosyltransferase [Methylococcales bacterium]|nr:phospholipid carrier-dependent glycosyltransferase [Methylococcales bacterium]